MLPEIAGQKVRDFQWEPGLETVLDYYDGPRLMLQQDPSGATYLSVWTDGDADMERWLALEIGRDRLRLVLQGEIPLREALENPQSGQIIVLDQDRRGGGTTATITTPRELPQDSLPRWNARLQIPFEKALQGKTGPEQPKREAPPGSDALYIRLHQGTISRSLELGADVVLDLDQDNRVLGVDIQHVSLLDREHAAEPPLGTHLKLVDPEHEDQLQARVENESSHLRRMVAAVVNDQEALRLMARLHDRESIETKELEDSAIPLAKITAANFAQVGAHLVHVTGPGRKFVQSIRESGAVPDLP